MDCYFKQVRGDCPFSGGTSGGVTVFSASCTDCVCLDDDTVAELRERNWEVLEPPTGQETPAPTETPAPPETPAPTDALPCINGWRINPTCVVNWKYGGANIRGCFPKTF